MEGTMQHHTRQHLSAIAILLGLLTACGSGGGSGGGSSQQSAFNPGAPVTLNSFTVTGTSAAVNGVAPISPGVNSGQFSFDWNITGNASFTTSVVVSADNVYDEGSDIGIAGGCGKTSIVDSCHVSTTINCTFNNSNIMTCNDPGGGTFPARDLTTFLSSGVPKSAYLVIRACDALMTSCPTMSAPIQIQ